LAVYRLPVTVNAPVAGKCMNVWHIRTTSNEFLPAELSNAVAAVKAFYGSIALLYPTGTSITADFAVDVENETDKPVSFGTVAGSGAGNLLAPHLAVCVSWKTGTRARRARGRTFLGPFISAVSDATGTVGDGNITQISNAANTLIGASQADNGWAVAVWGLQDPAPKGYAGNPADLPHVARDITGFAIADKFAVMRSRRP